MRETFVKTLTKLAEHDDRIILLVGDVGFRFIEDFRDKFPKQFLNCGVIEQSMMGIAVGLSKAGYKPYVYSMINFILMRPFEQVRNDICYQNANVKLFGVKGSEAYAFLGLSHNIYGSEEKDYLKNWPNINSYFPKTEEDCTENILKEYDRKGPAYFSI